MEEQDKYIDIDSTFRNRTRYENPYDFLIPYEFANKGSTGLSFFDPILSTTPYTGSLTKKSGDLVTGVSIDQTNITLDNEDINIDNFYINRTLQIGQEFSNIISYNGTTKVATLDEPFNVVPAPGTVYFIRNTRSYHNSDIALVKSGNQNTVNQFNLLNVDPSVLHNFFEGSFIRFTNGPHKNQTAALVVKYEPNGNIYAWEQDNSFGENVYMSTTTENGFRFMPSKSGQLSDITLKFNAFESVDAYRTFTLKILSGAGLGNPILYQNDFTISNTNIPMDFNFSIISGPNLYSSSYYTLSLIDITPGGSVSGFINMFGISPDVDHITYNCGIYPKENINVFSISSTPVWNQPNDSGSDSYIDTFSEQGFVFSVANTGIVNQVIINLISFESLSSGRTLNLKIRQGNTLSGTVLYQQNYTIPNQSSPIDYVFNISGSLNLTNTSLYTITVIDITSGGSISGYIDIFGIDTNSTYPTLNINTFPKMTLIYTPPESNIWTQNLDTGLDSIISTSYEQGYKFTSNGNGYISTIKLFLTSYDTSGNRTLQLKIRQGGNIYGTIIYSKLFNIENCSTPQNYTLNTDSGPLLSTTSSYTFTLQDVTSGGSTTGFINLFGIPSNITYNSYNSSLYPFTEISASLGGSFSVWSQNITSSSNNITSETGYLFTPSSSGVLTNLNLKIKTNNVSTTFVLKIREGSGLSGNILFQKSYTYNVANFTLTNIPIISGPFLSSGTSYTLTLQSSTLTFLIAGDTPNSTYIVYGTGNYPNMDIVFENGLSVWNQSLNPTYSSLIDTSEKGFQFTAGGTGNFTLTSIDLELFNFSGGTTRSLTVNVRNGSGLLNPIVFTTDFSVPQLIGRTLVNIPINYSSITSGSVYTISVLDNLSGTNGYIYFYGISPNGTYISYNSTTYPLINVKGNIREVGFSQLTNLTGVSNVSTSSEQGFVFTPSSIGKFSSVSMILKSFESNLSGRTLDLKVRNGVGTSGSIVYSSTFLISNHSSRFNFNFSTGNISEFTTSIYTLTIQDITSGGSLSGNIYIYGISPNSTYSSYNISVYPKLSIYASVPESTNSQLIDRTYTDVISNTIEQTFSIIPILPGILNSITLNLTSFSTLGGRTILLTLYEGPDNTNPIVIQENIIIPNTDSQKIDYKINLATSYILKQDFSYTLSLLDITGGSNNGFTWIYGIQPTQKYSSNNISVYPRLRFIIPSYTITITPPQNVENFLSNGSDNIEFNTQAFENATTIFIKNPPNKSIKYCEIELLTLTLPYQLLNSSQGGYVDDYPYVYVCLYDEGGESISNVLNSNNPNSSRALFKINIKCHSHLSFIHLKGKGNTQTIKFRPDMDLRLTILHPDGSILSNNTSDQLTPLFPNPLLQMSASLRIKYINQEE